MRALAIIVLCAALAPHNAMASPLKGDEEVILFPTSANRFGNDWEVTIHGWVFEPEHDSVWRRAVIRGLLRAMRLARADIDQDRFRERARWFLVDNERGKHISVRVGGSTFEMPESGKDGHFRGRLLIKENLAKHQTDDGWLTIAAVGDKRTFPGAVRLIQDRGWIVISDIDDTIKVTEVISKRRVLKNTFVEPYQSVPGMAALYQSWEGQGAAFHYLSAGPWQMYPLLEAFLKDQRFPRGTFALREFRAKDRRFKNLLKSPKKHKKQAIRDLLNRFPKHKFVLVGDTWEKDPEIFGEVARARKRQIARIILRRGPDDRWTPSRARKVFKGLEGRVYTFEDVKELPRDVYVLD